MSDGPRLPARAAPNRVILPAIDVWGQADLLCEDGGASLTFDLSDSDGSGEEDSVQEEVSFQEVEVGPACEEKDTSGTSRSETIRHGNETVLQDKLRCRAFSGLGNTGEDSGRSFHGLLLELAAEHKRTIARVHSEYAEAKAIATATELERLTAAQQESPAQEPAKPVILNPEWDVKPTQLSEFSGLQMQEFQTEGRVSPFDLVSESSSVAKRGTAERKGHRGFNPLRDRVENILGYRLPRTLSVAAAAELILRMDTLDSISSTIIVLNALFYGYVANESVAASMIGVHPDDVVHQMELITVPFTVWFFFELLVRLRSQGVPAFVCGDECAWNAFDVIMVGVDVAQTVVEYMASYTGSASASFHTLTVARTVRILRVTRAARLLRLLKTCRKLRVMVHSILRSGSALLWSISLLGVAVYIFGIYFTQVVAYHLYDLAGPVEPFEDLFKSIGHTTYTLYLCISGGVSWGMVCDMMFQIHEFHGLVFCFYIFSMTIAVLNIITGHFVETSLSSSRHSQEEVVEEQMTLTKVWIEDMKRIFATADANGSGTITLAEFEDYLQRDEVRAYLDALGIEIDKAKGLFQLLDLDMSGEISVEEFTFGCLRLRGSARSIDLATLINFIRRMGDQLRQFYSWSESQFKSLHDFEERVVEGLAVIHDVKPTPGVQVGAKPSCRSQASRVSFSISERD